MTTTQRTTMRDLALRYAARGWHVFPIAPGGKLPAIPAAHPGGDRARTSCRGGCGRLGHGVHDATTDPRGVAHWWTHCPTANIGIACGPSQLVVLDLDAPKTPDDKPPAEWALPGVTDGADVLAVLAERAGAAFPCDTHAVRTGRGGLHLYFQAPAGLELRNTAGRLGWLIDTRAAGGYVLAAGSTVDGRPYNIVYDVPPAPLPGWLTRALVPCTPEPVAARAVLANLGQPTGYVGAALRGEVQRVLDALPGQRNNTLNAAAYALGQLVGAGVLPARLAAPALQRAGEAIGLDPREAAATVRSGIRAGTKRPRRGGAA